MSTPAAVRFEPRHMQEDELSVVCRYIQHIHLCRICQTHKHGHLSFCPRGYGYVKDVRQYLYMKHDSSDDRDFSEIDLQRTHQDRQVQVADKHCAIRNILRGRGRAYPKIRLRTTQPQNPPPQERVKQSPATYGDSEYVTILARIPAITIPLQLRRSDLLKGEPRLASYHV